MEHMNHLKTNKQPQHTQVNTQVNTQPSKTKSIPPITLVNCYVASLAHVSPSRW